MPRPKGFKKIIADTLSYFDSNTKNDSNRSTTVFANEQTYHVYTLGLHAVLSDDYIIKSTRESGEGRYEIILIPRIPQKKGIIIEMKRIEKQKDNEEKIIFCNRINSQIDKALQEIEIK